MNATKKSVATFLLLAFLAWQPAAWGAAVPSKMTSEANATQRAADLRLAGVTFGDETITAALAAEGLTAAQVSSRLGKLTTNDVVALTASPDQVRSAGISMSRRAWIITGVVAAAVVGGLALYGDDDEDSDDSDDGED